MTKPKLNEMIRMEYTQKVMALFDKGAEVDSFDLFNEEEICRIASNKIAMPVVDAEGNEKWVTITVSVPTDDEFDGYTDAEVYAQQRAEKEAKAEANKKAKEEKAKRDAEIRKRKAEARAKREAAK